MSGKEYKLTSDCFIVPKKSGIEPEFIAYFPLQSLIFEVNEPAANILNGLKKQSQFIKDEDIMGFLDHLIDLGLVNGKKEKKPQYTQPESPKSNKTILLASDKCMLDCIYCYRGAEDTGDLMDESIAIAAVDTIIANAVALKKNMIEVGYHGGGEPTINWNVLVNSYKYAEEESNKTGLKFQSTICTNGIMSEDKAEWIARNIHHLAISIDGAPEIQNQQRPLRNGKDSFAQVAKTIDILNKYKRNYSLRVTATEHSEGKLFDNIVFLMERFHPRTICIEPLYVCGRCVTSGCQPPDVNMFIREMKDIYLKAQEKGIHIFYSGNRLSAVSSRFCGAIGSNFFITPRGEVTACLEVSELSDSRAKTFVYGLYNKEKKQFVYDLDVYKKLGDMQVFAMEECRDCISKWHCAGDCIAKVPDVNNIEKSRNKYRCTVNQTLAQDHLERIMKRKINEPHNTKSHEEQKI